MFHFIESYTEIWQEKWLVLVDFNTRTAGALRLGGNLLSILKCGGVSWKDETQERKNSLIVESCLGLVFINYT